MLLAAAVAIHAQYDSKAVEQKGANPAEQLASPARRGYVAPRVKTGFGNVLSSPFSGTVSLREAPARAPMKEYIEYVPDIKGMVFAPPSTVLNTISADGTLAPVSTVSLSAGMYTREVCVRRAEVTGRMTLIMSRFSIPIPDRIFFTLFLMIPRHGR